MGWIKMQNGLWTHPKVSLIAARLKLSKATAIGCLHGAWTLADEHSEAGLVRDLTREMIDAQVGHPGFAAEMVNIGWLEVTGDGVRYPRYEEHNGSTAKRRALDQRRSSAAASPASTADCPHGVRIAADKKRTREEKKEQGRTKTKKAKPSSSEALPPELDTPSFRAAWKLWEQHRREIKKTLTPTTRTKQLEMLEAAGVDTAISIIDKSIESGWTGLFKESKNGKPKHTTGPGQRHPADRRDTPGVF